MVLPPPPRKLGTSPVQRAEGGTRTSSGLSPGLRGGDVEERDRGGNRTGTTQLEPQTPQAELIIMAIPRPKSRGTRAIGGPENSHQQAKIRATAEIQRAVCGLDQDGGVVGLAR